MIVIIIQTAGLVLFLLVTLLLRKRLRKTPDKKTAEVTSRISHFLFWSCLILPGAAGIFYPGLTLYDEILGFKPLSDSTVLSLAGVLLAVAGLYFSAASNKLLMKAGEGAAAFKLTKNVVENGLYKLTRNPMSLGYYMLILGIGLMVNSKLITLGALLVVIPVHVFNLKYFEEFELEIRYGESYNNYKKDVAFMIPRLSFGARKRIKK